MKNELELAWASGLFEGEGCVYIDKRSYPRLRLCLAQRNNMEIVAKFQSIVGFGHISFSKKNNTDEWSVQGKYAHEIMELLRPYLGESSRKVQKYLKALEDGCVPEKHNRWHN